MLSTVRAIGVSVGAAPQLPPGALSPLGDTGRSGCDIPVSDARGFGLPYFHNECPVLRVRHR